MSKGPEQIRLESAVGHGVSRGVDASGAAEEWRSAAADLRSASLQLRTRSVTAASVSKQTGERMSDAFVRSADALDERATLLQEGADALSESARRVAAAEEARGQLRPLQDPGTYTGPSDPKTKEEVKAHSDWQTASTTYERDKKFNEDLARPHNTSMDEQNRRATAVMKRIHGEPDPDLSANEPSGGSGGAGGTTTTGSGATHHGTTSQTPGAGSSTTSPTGTTAPLESTRRICTPGIGRPTEVTGAPEQSGSVTPVGGTMVALLVMLAAADAVTLQVMVRVMLPPLAMAALVQVPVPVAPGAIVPTLKVPVDGV